MLRFLSKVRKNLIETRQIRRYALYALGEILLVVIGILLALQIDTLNTERMDRKKEILYLKEIRTNLEDDLDNIRYSIDFNLRKDSLVSAALTDMLEAETDKAALMAILQKMPVLAEFSIYTQNRVAFDNMLSAENIDLVSNETLRNQLSSYYAEENLIFGTQDRVKEMTRNFVDHITPLLMNRESIQFFFGVTSEFATAGDLNFKTNRLIFGDLFGMQRNLESHTAYLKYYQKDIEGLLNRIDEFLDQKG